MRKLGLYVHVPFCAVKCPYCDFYSVKYSRTTVDSYVEAVIAHMKRYASSELVADTLYFGGGTPSLLTGEHIRNIIEAAKEIFSFQGEITIEANPNSVSLQKLIAYRQAGVNRISYGVQSGVSKELEALGRKHTKEQVIQAADYAVAAGISNISADIMLGIPFQTQESLMETFNLLRKLPVTHVSAYMLKIEKNTPYAKSPLQSECADEDLLADMYLQAVDLLEQSGFLQYEISNFSKASFESKHNLKYWQQGEYLGFGPSAHSYYHGERFSFPNSILEYIATVGENRIVEETQVDLLEETILLGLRLKEGICPHIIESEFQLEQGLLERHLKKYCGCELMKQNEQRYFLTPKGFLVSNTIILELLETIGR